jgi:hypothetical protein
MAYLMEDPLFRAYMKRVPPAHNANREGSGNPWQLWVQTADHRWLTKCYPSYRAVWPIFVKRLRSTDDPTVTSRRVFYAPPGEWYDQKVRKPRRPTPDNPKTSQIVVERRWRQTFHWDGYDLHWCGRCRRPSYWMPLFSNHHALRRQPVIAEDANMRCIICGVRWITQPSIEQMEKMEAKG